jgi:hypothetical protein
MAGFFYGASRAHHTLQTTELIHEAYLKTWSDQGKTGAEQGTFLASYQGDAA